ncbi:MAG: glycosyltransferase [Chloroflexi bacterium]|nr:glycosyltransferase [Chloroflexota bacterium]
MFASVVIPAHNEREPITRCLQALVRQEGVPGGYEVIVVDDASSDGTAEVARAYGARVIVQAVRQGPAAARNAGALQAQGDVLLFLDADCEPAPTWCAEMLRPMADPSVCGVYGAYRTRQTSAVARFAQAEFDERYARLAQRERIDFLATHAAAIRRDVFLAVGGFRVDMRGNEDVELAFRLSQAGYRIVFAPQAVVYHEHPSTLRRYLRVKVSRGYWRTLAYARHPPKALADAYTPPWLKLQVAGIAAAVPALLLTILRPASFPLLLSLLVGLLLSTLPFVRFVQRREPDLLWVTPWLSLARSAALALGIGAGVVALAVNIVRRRTSQ